MSLFMLRKLTILLLVLLPFTSFSQSKLTYEAYFDYSTGYCPGDTQYDHWVNLITSLDTNSDKYLKMTMRGTYDMTGKTCSDKFAVRQIADALYQGYDASIPCDGAIWKVGTGCSDANCGNKSDYIELTLNQYTCNCGISYTIRPGITSPNWGGINTETCQWGAQNANQYMMLDVYRIFGNDNLTVNSFKMPDACEYKQDLYVNIGNYGANTVNDFYIGYSIDGVLQTPIYIGKPINSDETIQYMLESGFNFSALTKYDFKVWTYDPNSNPDSEPGNDTLNFTYIHAGTPPVPVADDYVNCGVGKVDIEAKSSDVIAWYDKPSGGSMLGMGPQFTTPFLRSTTNFYAEALRFKSPGSTLNTGFHNYTVLSYDPSQYNGAMIKIRANDMLRLTGIKVQSAFNNSNPYYRVYVREGGFSGYEQDSSTWTRIFDAELSNGGTYNTIPVELIMKPGVDYGLYVTTDPKNGEDMWIDYGVNSYNNGDISIQGGNYMYGLFGQIGTPWTLDCELTYEKTCVSNSREAVKVVINPKPFGSELIASNGFNGRYDLGSGNRPDVAEVGKNIQYELTVPTGYDNSDYDNTWTVNSVEIESEYGVPLNGSDFSFVDPTPGNNGRVVLNTKSYMLDSTLRIKIKISDKGPFFCDTVLVRSIHIAPTPKANFSVPNINCQFEDIVFTNLSTVHSGNLEYRWEFGPNDTTDFAQPVKSFSTPGVYSIKMTAITNPYRITKDTIINVTIGTVPQPSFKVQNACYGKAIVFTNQTPGTGLVHTWNFGDNGAQSNVASPIRNYASAGMYTVTLTTNLNGCKAVFKRNAHVFPTPVAGFDILTPNVCSNVDAEFKNTSNVLSGVLGAFWEFGDGEVNTASDPLHKYSSQGNYNVKLKSVSEFGCADSMVKNITVKPAPTVDFRSDRLCRYEETEFTNLSTEFSGIGSVYTWSFNDGITIIGKNYKRKWNNYGPAFVTLKSVLTNGCQSEITKEIEILKQGTADFIVSDICNGENAVFANRSSSDDGVMNYKWFFGDTSNVSYAVNPIKRYDVSTSTTFSVALVVGVPGGCEDTLVKQVTVTGTPTCEFSVAPNNNIGFNTYKFTPANNGYDTYEWMFGDGGTSMDAEPNYKYQALGTYDVTLNATDGECECTSTKKVSITQTGLDALNENNLKVYPNPADKLINLELDGNASVQIFNHLGQLVMTSEISEKGQMYIGDLSSGLYTVVIETGGVKSVVKVSVVH